MTDPTMPPIIAAFLREHPECGHLALAKYLHLADVVEFGRWCERTQACSASEAATLLYDRWEQAWKAP